MQSPPTPRRRFRRTPRCLLLALLCAPFAMAADETGCESEPSSAVSQDRIRAGYWTLYASAEDVTYARAQFRLGTATGTTLELSDGASVAFDGQTLGFNALLDWQELPVAGLPADGTAFVYRDVDGSVFTNPMPQPLAVDVPSDTPTRLDARAAHTIPWGGAPLGEDEVMEMVVAREANRLDFVRVDATSPGATAVVVPAGRLSRVGLGAAVLVFRRHRALPLVEGTAAGGERTTTWQSGEHVLVLE